MGEIAKTALKRTLQLQASFLSPCLPTHALLPLILLLYTSLASLGPHSVTSRSEAVPIQPGPSLHVPRTCPRRACISGIGTRPFWC